MRFVQEYKREFIRNAHQLNNVYDAVFKFDKLMDFRNRGGLWNRLADFVFMPLLLPYYASAILLSIEPIPESLARNSYSRIVRK